MMSMQEVGENAQFTKIGHLKSRINFGKISDNLLIKGPNGWKYSLIKYTVSNSSKFSLKLSVILFTY